MDAVEFNDLINTLQNSGESERLEAKQTASAVGKSVLETISAFSNEPGMLGGYLILGLSRNSREESPYYSVTGIKDPDQAQSEVVSVCRGSFNITVRPILEVFSYQEKNLLIVYIPEAEPHDKPVYIQSNGVDKGTFRRIGPTDQRCTKEDLHSLYQLRSRKKYDETIVEYSSFNDFDPQAIAAYRQMRKEVNALAEELKYTDEDLLQSLSVLVPHQGTMVPTVAGLILFGTAMSLRRLFPIVTRVDYIMIEGREWVPDPERRYHSIEMREGLITMIPQLLRSIMTNIPQTFALDDEAIQRKDNPLIPRQVVREALCNALIHRDYTRSQPVQVRHYANRIELANPGYSLKPESQLGLPGSIARNDKIATILHDINLAETKGTGIRSMRDAMREANLTAPLIESDRESNQFTITLLSHHLFDKNDIEWLGRFKTCGFTDEEARTLIVVREMGAITNADYRMINSVDTLTASSHLRRLRDLGFLEQKGRGNTTYYVPTRKALFSETTPRTSPLSGELAPHTSPLSGELAPHTSPLSGELTGQISGLPLDYPSLPEALKEKIASLKKRESPEIVKDLIVSFCSLHPLRLSEIAAVLSKNPKYVRENYLNAMIDLGELEHVFPDQPNHPQQAYRAKKS